MAKKKFSMTENKTAVDAFKEAQEKKEKKDKAGKEKSVTEKKPSKTKQTAQKEEKKKEKKSTLTARDREMMKSDFDAPSVDPGQTELFESEKNEKREKRRGQPKKYNEEVKPVSFALPLSVIEKLEDLSAIHKINKTQIIIRMIEKTAEEEKEGLEAYKKILKVMNK